MSAALDYLNAHGLQARADRGRIVISPASKLTQDVRQFIQTHRLELLEELISVGLERRRCWRVVIPGKASFPMIGTLCTHTEALVHAQGIWPDAEITA